MRKMIYMICLLCFGLQGCDNEIKYQYDDVNRLYFDFVDSVRFSFGKLPEEVTVDTAKIVVRLLGNASAEPRTYRVKVLENGTRLKGTTDMVAGVHYEPLEEKQVFGPDRFQDTLRIVLFREPLSSSFRNPEFKTLMLALESGDDFQVELDEGREMKLSVNNFLAAPLWWEEYSNLLKWYHPKKWLFLIEQSARFDNENEFTGTDAEMQTKSWVMSDWLNKNVIVDDETGMRVTMSGLEELTNEN
ncbi:MAG: DUF4843 domain-containing protein [Odoribacter sp.]|nr:DUF4843 domain-containing protein [Odoribacter sp.]